MIGVAGVAKVLFNNGDNKLNLEIDRDDLVIKFLEKIDDGTCKIWFLLIINELSEYKILDDYRSLVRPNLQPHVNGLLTYIEIIDIQKMGTPPIKHISEL